MKLAKGGLTLAAGVGLGVVATFLLTSVDVISGPQAVQASTGGPKLEITYIDFISISLTAVTTILAATAIGVGAVAYYTIRDLKDDARKAVQEQVGGEAERLKAEIRAELANFQKRMMGYVRGNQELEEDFDPEDAEER